WVGSDYPLEWPENVPPASMTLRDSTLLPLNASDPRTAEEWVVMSNIPGGFGRMRLGPDKRIFVLGWYHQIHCLWQIQAAILNRHDGEATTGHMRHCLNQLRQGFLCDANGALEQGDFMEHIGVVAETGSGDAICKDWDYIHRETLQNQADFEEYAKQLLD
ncbi:hypothetical protein DL96DRAFT_1473431, partial [Flagelloscypha sp. PMI_526]